LAPQKFLPHSPLMNHQVNRVVNHRLSRHHNLLLFHLRNPLFSHREHQVVFPLGYLQDFPAISLLYSPQCNPVPFQLGYQPCSHQGNHLFNRLLNLHVNLVSDLLINRVLSRPVSLRRVHQ
jgi:hypothetical protein